MTTTQTIARLRELLGKAQESHDITDTLNFEHEFSLHAGLLLDLAEITGELGEVLNEMRDGVQSARAYVRDHIKDGSWFEGWVEHGTPAVERANAALARLEKIGEGS